MTTLLLALLAAIAGLLVVGYVAGLRLDPRREVRVDIELPAAVHEVYDVLAHIDRYALWRDDVERIEWVGEREPPTWIEVRPTGRLRLELASENRPTRRVHRVAQASDPFDGEWVFELSPIDDRTTKLTLTERGTLKNPLFRAFWRFFVDHDQQVEAWRRSLIARLVSTPTGG